MEKVWLQIACHYHLQQEQTKIQQKLENYDKGNKAQLLNRQLE
jgi:hypothetical protein